MSKKYPGGVLSKTAPVPSGGYEGSTASGIWNMDDVAKYRQEGLWPTAGSTPSYIEDFFSTYLYTGNGSSQLINNGVALGDTPVWSSYAYSAFGTIANINASSSGIAVIGLQPTGVSIANRLNTSETTLWSASQTSSGATGNTYQRAVFTDSSGNVYTTGRAIEGGGSFGERSTVSKYDSSGTLLWQRLLDSAAGTSGNFQTYSIVVDSSGNVFVGGMHYFSSNYRDVIIKYNSSGTLQWKRSLAQDTQNGMDGALLALSSSDELYVAGKGHDGSNPFYCYVAKLNNSDGLTAWQRKLSTGLYDTCGSITVDSAGSVYIGGYAKQYSTPIGFIAKYNSSGTIQFQSAITGATSPVSSLYSNAAGSIFIATTNRVIRITSSGVISSQFKTNGSNLKLSGTGTTLYAAGSFNGVPSFIDVPDTFTTISGQAGSAIISGSRFTLTSLGATDSAGSLTNIASTINDTAAGASITNAVASSTPTSSSQVAVTGTGGMVWMKSRSSATTHRIFDTTGRVGILSSDTTNPQNESGAYPDYVYGTATGFNADSAIANSNDSSVNYVSWAFRKQPKFFDVVAYNGNGVDNRDIAHSLNSTPGAIFVKCTNSAQAWRVWHRSLTAGNNLELNASDGQFADTAIKSATSSTFRVNSASNANASGNSYVAYIFAHNAGGFGLSGNDSVISCGTFTTDGSANATVELGWEPQWVLTKTISAAGAWYIADNMRGYLGGVRPTSNQILYANIANAEVNSSVFLGTITSTGFKPAMDAGTTSMYIAIRRGPMKVPTVGTQVFSPIARTGTGSATTLTTGFPVDSVWSWQRAGAYKGVFDRLRPLGVALFTNVSSAEGSAYSDALTGFDSNTGIKVGADNTWGGLNISGSANITYNFRRAPGFFDQVAWRGTVSSGYETLSHNLGVAPELIIYRTRNGSGSTWYALSGFDATQCSQSSMGLNNTNGRSLAVYANNDVIALRPTSTNVHFGFPYSSSSMDNIAYLFASCPGVSKVGTYTGTASNITVDCGFPGGARFVLVKRTDSTGPWIVVDTARGMVAGSNYYAYLNTTDADSSANILYTISTGFQVRGDAGGALNASGGTYLFLAIA